MGLGIQSMNECGYNLNVQRRMNGAMNDSDESLAISRDAESSFCTEATKE
jgi:hypothetical protein